MPQVHFLSHNPHHHDTPFDSLPLPVALLYLKMSAAMENQKTAGELFLPFRFLRVDESLKRRRRRERERQRPESSVMVFQRERRRKRADPFVLSFSLFFSTVPTRPKVTPLHGGGLDLEEVQKKLLEEFARAARESPSFPFLLLLFSSFFFFFPLSLPLLLLPLGIAIQADHLLRWLLSLFTEEDPVKNNLPTAEELQGDFDALIEARALKLIESRSRSGSFSLSGGGSPFHVGGGGMSSLPASSSTRSPNPTSSPPLPLDHQPARPPVHHLPSGLSMTSAVPSTSSPLTMTPSTAPFVNHIHDEPSSVYDSSHVGESAISSGMTTPNTGASLSRQTSRSGSSRPGSRRPSMKMNVNNYEVR
ncbi:hypothetical protein BDY24DRAFT_386423 [Mrakia frigida]|uniref:uncharacterized protein n=1 Tax=Mrakia frigida TaxID=29902 RepID=UPI003FCC21FE